MKLEGARTMSFIESGWRLSLALNYAESVAARALGAVECGVRLLQ
jgi:hypothetical protein